jgi:hypothetical protein
LVALTPRDGADPGISTPRRRFLRPGARHPLISSLADRLVVVDQGHVIATGPPADVLADERVISSYLGVPTPA